MLAWLADLTPHTGPLNVFRYITFRTGGAIGTALLFVFFFGPAIIAALRLKQGKGSRYASMDRSRTCSPKKAPRPWAA